MTRVTKHGSKNLYWSFGATFVLQTFMYVGSFLVNNGSKHHHWSFGATFVLQM